MSNHTSHAVGVIVGRFQVPELHEAHKQLIQEVCDRHDKVVIVLGLSEAKVTRENPLDYQARLQMIQEEVPRAIVAYIHDDPSDKVWSKNLDRVITTHLTPNQKPMLYGGRDSFVDHYHGRFDTEELEPETYVRYSGTEARREVARQGTRNSPDFRAGVCWAAWGQWPRVMPTVDIAILNEDNTEVLLGTKPGETKLRFIGGFVDVTDASLEAAARREAKEETNLEVTDPKYIWSGPVDDWRYRSEDDMQIMTSLFVCKKQFGTLKPLDDIETVKWVEVDEILVSDINPSHAPLFEALLDYIDTIQS